MLDFLPNGGFMRMTGSGMAVACLLLGPAQVVLRALGPVLAEGDDDVLPVAGPPEAVLVTPRVLWDPLHEGLAAVRVRLGQVRQARRKPAVGRVVHVDRLAEVGHLPLSVGLGVSC